MRVLGWLALAGLLASARAQEVDLLELQARRGPEGIVLDFAVRTALPAAVEDAARRGVPLYFTARATVLRPRWYWRDERVARARRTWRVSYTPLTSNWRVSEGGLHRTYESLADAMLAVTRLSRWEIADANRLEPHQTYEVEFEWGLDTGQLPPPLQIGIGTQAEWVIRVERTLRLRPERD